MWSQGLLFCTANLDPEVIEKFISESSRPATVGAKQWLLVRSASEGITGPPLDRCYRYHPEFSTFVAPKIKPFKTGFLNATLDSLFNYVRLHSRETNSRSLPGDLQYEVEGSLFAVLDARSAHDGTVLLYHLYGEMPREYDQETDGRGPFDEELCQYRWIEWRVRFLWAAYFANQLTIMSEYADFQIDRDTYIDGEGVLQWPYLENDDYEMPNFPDEEKVPWGPEKSQEEKDREYINHDSPLRRLLRSGEVKSWPVREDMAQP